ncbi:MAG: response regulator [Desulfoprunum sp.]|nr:response regulator [Desulfoprunum sp.]
MNKSEIIDDELLFCDEESGADEGIAVSMKPWKVMIVDDEESVHAVTRMVFDDFVFEGKRIEFISAYSAAKAKLMLDAHPDTAIVLLDVVMEQDDSGLLLTRHIREVMGNRFVRIVLRTGQPGMAPQEKVIIDYDINDYIEKTDLTSQKFHTTIISSLRSYRDIMESVELSRQLQEEIAERTQAEEKLRKSEDRMRLFFERQLVGMAITSPEKGWLQVNDRLCGMLGYSREELAHLSWAELTYPEDLELDIAQFDQLLAGDIDDYTIEKRFVRKDGELLHTNLAVACVRHPDGTTDYVLALLEDLTDRKRAEKEREKLQAQLIQAQKMESVGQLAGGVAHDFNNMLGVILGYAEIAQSQLDPAHPLFNNLEEIRKAAIRSADITRQLLTFARKQNVEPKVLDLNETVEGMLKMLRRLIGEDINLAWLPGTGLWQIKMDPSQIDQILANLCINARHAIAGVGKITVETGNSTLEEEYCASHAGFVSGEYVRISVSDNGCGMDKETLSHIFEPFFTTKSTGQGTGLGLATVYGAVKQNNGFIYAYSEPGQGTTFTIYLPRYMGRTGQVWPESAAASTVGGHETILLVEDEPTILEITKMMLQGLGYTVLTASIPSEAIRLASEPGGKFDLLLTDVVMPEMNGRDLAQRLLISQPGMKCLFMSGYTANIIANQGVLDESVSFIQKPFSVKELAAKVRQALTSEILTIIKTMG